MESVGRPNIGLSPSSLWSYSPKVNHFRPTVEDGKMYLEDVKYTSSDLSKMKFDEQVPIYTIDTLTPQTPKMPIKVIHQPTTLNQPSSSVQSTTNILMSQAQAIISYKDA